MVKSSKVSQDTMGRTLKVGEEELGTSPRDQTMLSSAGDCESFSGPCLSGRDGRCGRSIVPQLVSLSIRLMWGR